MRAALVRTCAGLALLTAGCSVSASSVQLTPGDVETGVGDALEREVGGVPQDIDCPDGMAAEVGESVRCTLTVPEGLLGATATVKSVDGDHVVLGVEVDEQLLDGTTP